MKNYVNSTRSPNDSAIKRKNMVELIDRHKAVFATLDLLGIAENIPRDLPMSM